jgi:hypothetical protein
VAGIGDKRMMSVTTGGIAIEVDFTQTYAPIGIGSDATALFLMQMQSVSPRWWENPPVAESSQLPLLSGGLP